MRLAPSAPFGQGPRTRYERDSTVQDVFAAQAARSPEAPAVADAAGTWTYAELERRANRLARRLRAFGVAPGARVGVAFERSAHLPETLLAILKAGAAYVPLDVSYPGERLAFMCADAGVSLAITAGSAADGLPDALPRLDLRADADAIAALDDRPLSPAGSADAIAYVTYTSGSTGRPKGVAVEHRGIVRLVRGADYVDISPADAFLHFAPLAFDASTFDIWAPLLNGALLAIPRPGLLAIEELVAAIDRFGVTTLFLTTSIFERLVDAQGARPRSLRTVLTGGEVASREHMLRFRAAYPQCRLVAVYGPTENTTFSTWCEIGALPPGESVPIGRAIANSSAYVLDEHLEPVDPGGTGELCVGGDGVARGYVNQPELSASRFVADPFSREPGARLYRTGDRARYRSDGSLEFLGRSDGQVKLRGFRVELGEIETALRAHPGVAAAAVVTAERGGEKALLAYVKLVPGARAQPGTLREHLARRLPPFMLPHQLEILDALPLRASGKIDREQLAARSLAPPNIVALRPGGSTQDAVATLWRGLLGAAGQAGLDVNFFDAGGDSLSLLSLHRQLQERFGVKFGVTDLFTQTTVRKQAAFVERLRNAQA